MMIKQRSPDVLKQLKKHTSVRKYKEKKVEMETLRSLLRAAQHAASSNFVQAYSVILVTDKDKKGKIGELSNNQSQINSAPVLILFCADMKRLEYACRKKGSEIQQQTTENFMVAIIDTALFAQNFVVAAESEGYGICFIGGVRNNPKEIGSIVGLPDKVFPLFGMTVGIPDEQQFVKPRIHLDAVLHENTYNEEKYHSIIDEYDQIISDYYKSRLTNNKESDWSETMSSFLSEPRREHMKSFLAEKGFHLK